MTKAERQCGYTLLEVIVAFAILALSLGALYESFSMTLRRSEKVRNMTRAELLMESVRDRLGVDIPVEQPVIAGEDSGCSWHLQTQAVEHPKLDHPPTLAARQVAVDVSCGEAGAIGNAHLDTVELVQAK